MIASIDGRITGPDGRSGSLGGRTDRMLLADLRGSADIILVGRGTTAAERYGPPRVPDTRREAGQAPGPRLAIVTTSGSLDPGDPAVRDPARLPLVLTTDRGAERLDWLPADCVLTFGSDGMDLALATHRVSTIGLGRVVCEGGPQLLGSLLAADLVDELCLTLSPKTVGEGPPLATGPRPPADWDLATARAVDSFLFLHYLRRRGG